MSLKKEFSTLNNVLRIIPIAIAVLVCGDFCTASPILQDNATETAATETAAAGEDSLEAMLGKWKDLETELISLETQFNEATEPAQKEDFRGKYRELVDQANDMVVSIKNKATEAFESRSDDEKTARLLVGILKNDAEFGRGDDAMKLGDKLIAGGVDGTLFETAAKSDKISITTRELMEELFVRFNQHKMDTLPQVKITTSKGELVVELFEEEAPNTVANFISLVENKFYDGLKFHRVIEGFVAQGGDPQGNGSGGPGYTIECECDEVEARRHFIGSLSMAHAGKDTGGSQFFMCLTQTSSLNERHTVFGRVIDGIEVLDKLSRNYTPAGPIPNSDTDIIETMEVIRKRDHEYKPVKIGDDVEEEKIDPPPSQPETLSKDSEKSAASTEDKDESAGGEESSGEESSGEESSGEESSGEESSGEESSGEESSGEESESADESSESEGSGGGDDNDG